MSDHGLGEGIYVQFESPVPIFAIEVKGNAPVRVSVNGSEVSRAHEGEGTQHFYKQTDDQSEMTVKSVFVNIEKAPKGNAEISAIRFYPKGTVFTAKHKGNHKQPTPLVLNLPLTEKAKASASSTLDPIEAYQPANLFDSRLDFAWATNGKKTSGVNETFSLDLEHPQTIAGLLIWNGYQRSPSHFAANGRVAELDITDGSAHHETVTLADKTDDQRLMLKSPFADAKKLIFKIKKIYNGAKYKDVLLSEMRLLGAQAQIIALDAPHYSPKVVADMKSFVNRSLSSGVCETPSFDPLAQSFKFRDDGTFVIFKHQADETGGDRVNIWEGNWTQTPKGIRIFGKRYSRQKDSSYMSYGLAEQGTAPEIFQTDVKLEPFSKLTKTERKVVVENLIKAKSLVSSMNTDKEINKLVEAKALSVQSPLFFDVVVPSDNSGACL